MKTKKRPRRLRKRNSFSTILAFVSLAAVGGAYAAYNSQPQAIEQASTEPVKIASEDDIVFIPTPVRTIARGERLSDVEFTDIKWPQSRLNGSYIRDLPRFKNAVAVSQLPKLLPVPISAVSFDSVDTNAVVEGIPLGMRAITVKVDAESAVEGWARSGNYVDVIVIRASKNRDVGLEAKVIAENVKILSAGRSTDPLNSGTRAPKAPSTVTLLVNQEDALKIKTAAAFGKLTFALRGTGDELPANSVSVDQRSLLGSSKSVSTSPAQFLGTARGPDGKLYVLGDNKLWIQAEELPAGASASISKLASKASKSHKDKKRSARAMLK